MRLQLVAKVLICPDCWLSNRSHGGLYTPILACRLRSRNCTSLPETDHHPCRCALSLTEKKNHHLNIVRGCLIVLTSITSPPPSLQLLLLLCLLHHGCGEGVRGMVHLHNGRRFERGKVLGWVEGFDDKLLLLAPWLKFTSIFLAQVPKTAATTEQSDW